MALVRETWDSEEFIECYGEPIETFREEWEFEVDGINYIHPWQRRSYRVAQVVRPMFELKSDNGA
jgi:hypothetical protein